jgi:hypothetical protein
LTLSFPLPETTWSPGIRNQSFQSLTAEVSRLAMVTAALNRLLSSDQTA